MEIIRGGEVDRGRGRAARQAKEDPLPFTHQAPPPQPSEPPTLWIEEAITYLGLDRVGLKRPDKKGNLDSSS